MSSLSEKIVLNAPSIDCGYASRKRSGKIKTETDAVCERKHISCVLITADVLNPVLKPSTRTPSDARLDRKTAISGYVGTSGVNMRNPAPMQKTQKGRFGLTV